MIMPSDLDYKQTKQLKISGGPLPSPYRELADWIDAQLKAHQDKGVRDLYIREYSRLTEQYDEFGYLRTRGISVSLDSKENFDTNFQGNWFYYDRTEAQNASAEDLFVVVSRTLDVGNGEKMRDTDSLSRGHLIALLPDLYAAH